MKNNTIKSFKKAAIVSAMALCSLSANADIRINGFANFVLGTSSDADQTNLAGNVAYDDSIRFSNDSLFALQVIGEVNSKVSATAQIIARGSEGYQAEFEWAYLTYQASDQLSVSLGRFRSPFFRYSSSADIGYSYHWLTAPSSVYDVGFNVLNGFRVDYSDYAGDWEYNLQMAGGTYESALSGGTLSGKDTLVFTAEAVYDWFRVRGVWGRATASFENEFFSNAFASIEAGSEIFTPQPEIAELLRVNDDMGIFVGLGLEADFYDWFIAGEFTSVNQTSSFAGTDEAVYVTAGMRVGSFTPSVTFERLDGTVDGIRFENAVAEIEDPTTRAYIGVLNAAYQGAAQDKYDKLTATLRYDVDANFALKFEVSKFSDKLDDANDTTIVRLGANYVF